MPKVSKPKVRRPGSIRDQREDATLRRFLVQLADSQGNAKPGTKSIETVSRQWNIESDRLRDFRDGTSESLDRSMVSVLNRLLGQDDNGMLGIDTIDPLGFGDPSRNGWYGAMMAEEGARGQKLETFHLIDRTRPEANSALHAWSDLGITGNISGDRYGGGFQPVIAGAAQTTVDAINKAEQNINGRLLPDDKKLLVFRGMAKFGDQWGEIGLAEKGGRLDIDRLYPRHARTMYVNRDKDGKYDPTKAFKQVMQFQNDQNPAALYPEWKMARFSNLEGWGDIYGTSIFDPCLRSYIQIEAMESGMIVRRLERAAMRFKHIIDVGMLSGQEEINKARNDYRTEHRKIPTVDGNRNMRKQKIAMPVGEDFIIPKRDKDSVSDIVPLAGDEYIEQIGDVMHFFKKWLSGLGPPSSHLGYEDEGSKTGVNDKHIVFARKVRRMQLKFIAGLNHLYWVSLILKGIDPRTVRYTIFPPAMNTRDELLRAQILLANSTTCQYLNAAFGATGKVPSIEWNLKYIMGFDDEVIDSLELKDVIPKPGKNSPGFKNAPPKNVKEAKQMGEMAAADPMVASQTRTLQWMLEERAITLKTPRATEWIRQSTLPNWADDFDGVVRSMGVRSLAVAE